MCKSHDIITSYLRPLRGLGQNRTPWSHHPSQVLGIRCRQLFPFSKNQSLLQRMNICQTWEHSQAGATGSEGSLKRRIPEMFGAIATSFVVSKDYIYPKVTTLKRVKSIYTVSLIFFYLIQQQQLKSFLSWLSVLSNMKVNIGHWECPRRSCWCQHCKWHYILTKSMSFNTGLTRWLQITADPHINLGGTCLGSLLRKWKTCSSNTELHGSGERKHYFHREIRSSSCKKDRAHMTGQQRNQRTWPAWNESLARRNSRPHSLWICLPSSPMTTRRKARKASSHSAEFHCQLIIQSRHYVYNIRCKIVNKAQPCLFMNINFTNMYWVPTMAKHWTRLHLCLPSLIKCVVNELHGSQNKWQISPNKALLPLSCVTIWTCLRRGSYFPLKPARLHTIPINCSINVLILCVDNWALGNENFRGENRFFVNGPFIPETNFR